ncbi:hypothetical protein GIB67_037497 [Kingdonia uniflora]|uniref:Wall-associated receptor kinase C-terminal domain-containing protein n=1 Tax=Kingdonia uniflora TaxID=39325 RepID=A0A7J7KX78_9MAGN|nr:hypothetical protein GIB67_037497 [Kingdonia uniflora]
MSVIYKVLYTNKVDRTMTISRNDLSEDVCSFVNVNTTLSPTSFDFDPGNKNFILLYGCPPIPNIQEGMTCPIIGTPNRGAYFIPQDDLSKNSNYAGCHTNVIVPVHAVDVDKYMGQMFPQIKSVVEDILKKGFLVKYDASEYSSCLACDKDHKRCVYNTTSIVCGPNQSRSNERKGTHSNLVIIKFQSVCTSQKF